MNTTYKIVIDLDDTIYSQQKFTEYWDSLDSWYGTHHDFTSPTEWRLVNELMAKYPTVILTDSGLIWLPEKLRILGLQHIPLMNAKHSSWHHFHPLVKPNDCLFRYSMWYLQGTPENTVFIGDRPNDIPKWAQHGYMYTYYAQKYSGRTDFPGKEVHSMKEIIEDLNAKARE